MPTRALKPHLDKGKIVKQKRSKCLIHKLFSLYNSITLAALWAEPLTGHTEACVEDKELIEPMRPVWPLKHESFNSTFIPLLSSSKKPSHWNTHSLLVLFCSSVECTWMGIRWFFTRLFSDADHPNVKCAFARGKPPSIIMPQSQLAGHLVVVLVQNWISHSKHGNV